VTRVAVPLLLAFIALLVFIGWSVSTRRARRSDLIARQRERISDHDALLYEIYDIAFDAADVDPSSELILMKISEFRRQKELP